MCTARIYLCCLPLNKGNIQTYFYKVYSRQYISGLYLKKKITTHSKTQNEINTVENFRDRLDEVLRDVQTEDPGTLVHRQTHNIHSGDYTITRIRIPDDNN